MSRAHCFACRSLCRSTCALSMAHSFPRSRCAPPVNSLMFANARSSARVPCSFMRRLCSTRLYPISTSSTASAASSTSDRLTLDRSTLSRATAQPRDAQPHNAQPREAQAHAYPRSHVRSCGRAKILAQALVLAQAAVPSCLLSLFRLALWSRPRLSCQRSRACRADASFPIEVRVEGRRLSGAHVQKQLG